MRRREHEIYHLPPHPDWPAVTDVPCPVAGCDQFVVWYEAGHVPGYRACMARSFTAGFNVATLRHRFLAGGDATAPVLIHQHTSLAEHRAANGSEHRRGEG